MDKIEKFYMLPEDERPMYYLKHMKVFTKDNVRKYIVDKELKKYYYLITFTLRQECADKSAEAEDYIIKQFRERKALGILEAHYVKEQTKAGIDHFHVAVCTSQCLAKNRFKYYEKLYGFIDISKNKQKTLTNGLEYISKSGTPIRLV